MAVDLNFAAACTGLNAIYDGDFPAGSLLELRTGTPPGAEAGATGTLLASITTPASPWAAADTGTGTKAKAGTWSGLSVAIGIIGHYRFKNAADTRREEGLVGATGAQGVEATVNDLTVGAIGITVAVSLFTKSL